MAKSKATKKAVEQKKPEKPEEEMILVPVKLLRAMNRVAHNTQARKILLARQNESAKKGK